MCKPLLTLSVFAALSFSSIARADDAYSYSFSGTGVSGSGIVTLADTAASDTFQVTSISGQVNTIDISGLLPSATYNNNDNLFYNGDPFLDPQGVSFQLSNGADVNISFYSDDYYFEGDGNFILDGGTPPMPQFQRAILQPLTAADSTTIQLSSFTFAPLSTAATPEPSSLALAGTGLAALAAFLRRRVEA